MAFEQDWHRYWGGASWRFQESLRRLAETGDIKGLVDALKHVYSAIEALASGLASVEERLARVEGRLEKLNEISLIEARLEKLEHAIEEQRTSIAALKESQEQLARAISRIDMNVGGLTEATLSRFFIEWLERSGARVLSAERNARIDNIDLLVVAEKSGRRTVYIVEVKVRPDHEDVGRLIVLADLYEAREGERPQPVLAGVWIGSEVEAYARKKGVTVFRV